MNVLQMSVSAGTLILIIVVIRAFAINRLPKKMFIALWGIALARLIIPFSIPFSIPAKFSIYNVLKRFVEDLALKANTANGGSEATVLIYRSTQNMGLIYNPLQIEPIVFLWMAGTAFFVLFFGAAFYKGYREIRTALPIKDNPMIDRWLGEQKTYRLIKILVSDKVITPLTYGIINPKIILPKSMDYSNELQLRYILTHELIHIKRFDVLWKLLLVVALCFHWYNPMVWVLYILMNRDLEIACDERVIHLFGESKKSEYALSLIELAERKTGFSPIYSSFSTNATEERIVSIMKFKKTSVFSLVLAFILIVGATSVFAESAANTALRIYGVIQTDSGRYSFDSDEKGIVTVKDAHGRVVSTTTVGDDSKVTLTDDSGNIIKTLYLTIPKAVQRKQFLTYNAQMAFKRAELDVINGIITDADTPRLIAEVDMEGFVTIRDAGGRVVGTGMADNNGIVTITDNNGVEIGSAIIDGSRVNKLIININNYGNRNATFFGTDNSM